MIYSVLYFILEPFALLKFFLLLKILLLYGLFDLKSTSQKIDLIE